MEALEHFIPTPLDLFSRSPGGRPSCPSKVLKPRRRFLGRVQQLFAERPPVGARPCAGAWRPAEDRRLVPALESGRETGI